MDYITLQGANTANGTALLLWNLEDVLKKDFAELA